MRVRMRSSESVCIDDPPLVIVVNKTIDPLYTHSLSSSLLTPPYITAFDFFIPFRHVLDHSLEVCSCQSMVNTTRYPYSCV
jgi:hypothetical protein